MNMCPPPLIIDLPPPLRSRVKTQKSTSRVVNCGRGSKVEGPGVEGPGVEKLNSDVLSNLE